MNIADPSTEPTGSRRSQRVAAALLLVTTMTGCMAWPVSSSSDGSGGGIDPVTMAGIEASNRASEDQARATQQAAIDQANLNMQMMINQMNNQ